MNRRMYMWVLTDLLGLAPSDLPSIMSRIRNGSLHSGRARPTRSVEPSCSACSIAFLERNPPVTQIVADLMTGLSASANSMKNASRFFVDSFLWSNARLSYVPADSSIKSQKQIPDS